MTGDEILQFIRKRLTRDDDARQMRDANPYQTPPQNHWEDRRERRRDTHDRSRSLDSRDQHIYDNNWNPAQNWRKANQIGHESGKGQNDNDGKGKGKAKGKGQDEGWQQVPYNGKGKGKGKTGPPNNAAPTTGRGPPPAKICTYCQSYGMCSNHLTMTCQDRRKLSWGPEKNINTPATNSNSPTPPPDNS